MKPAPEWQASYQTMGSLRFPFYHKLSFSSVQIYLFHRQKYLFFSSEQISFLSHDFFFINSNFSFSSVRISLLSHAFFSSLKCCITSHKFLLQLSSHFFFPKTPQSYLLKIRPKYFTQSHFSGHRSC